MLFLMITATGGAFASDNSIEQPLSSKDVGTDVSITGYVYISEADGSVVIVGKEYSIYPEFSRKNKLGNLQAIKCVGL